MAIHELVIGAVVLFTLIAAWTDLRTGHIPNRVVVAFAGVAVVLRLVEAATSAAALDALASMVVGVAVTSLVPLLLFRMGAMGGGDVKLLGALGLAVGPQVGLEVELVAFVVASLYACGRLAYEGRLFRLLGNTVALVARPLRSRENRGDVSPDLMTSLRFAPALFTAALVLAYGTWRAS